MRKRSSLRPAIAFRACCYAVHHHDGRFRDPIFTAAAIARVDGLFPGVASREEILLES
jgi:hypothetical protein